MPYPKIATCSYCGTRAALVLTGQGRHELACSACGAPLHDLKALKVDRPAEVHRERPMMRHRPSEDWHRPPKRKPRRRKSLGKRLFGEALDLIEDIFD